MIGSLDHSYATSLFGAPNSFGLAKAPGAVSLGRVKAPTGAYNLTQAKGTNAVAAAVAAVQAAAPLPQAFTQAGNPEAGGDDIAGLPRMAVIAGAAVVGLGVIGAIVYKMRKRK